MRQCENYSVKKVFHVRLHACHILLHSAAQDKTHFFNYSNSIGRKSTYLVCGQAIIIIIIESFLQHGVKSVQCSTYVSEKRGAHTFELYLLH